jgi:hypothetical protein
MQGRFIEISRRRINYQSIRLGGTRTAFYQHVIIYVLLIAVWKKDRQSSHRVRLFVHRRVGSAVKRVEFVSDKTRRSVM